jgi:hypothetical protein
MATATAKDGVAHSGADRTACRVDGREQAGECLTSDAFEKYGDCQLQDRAYVAYLRGPGLSGPGNDRLQR